VVIIVKQRLVITVIDPIITELVVEFPIVIIEVEFGLVIVIRIELMVIIGIIIAEFPIVVIEVVIIINPKLIIVGILIVIIVELEQSR